MGEHVDPARPGPADVRQMTRSDLDTFTLAARVDAAVGPGADALVRAMLADLFDTAHDVPGAGASADRITSDVLEALHEFDQAARTLRRRLDRADRARAGLHRAIDARAAQRRHEAVDAEVTRQRDEAERKALAARLEAVEACCAAEALTLDGDRRTGAAGRYRLITDTPAHRLLPHRFDDPAGWRAVDVIVRGGRRWYVLPESGGTLANVEAWLAHRCGYTPPEPAMEAAEVPPR